jgi:hypothetical protein
MLIDVKCLCKKVKHGPNKKKGPDGTTVPTMFKDGPLAVSKAAQNLASQIVAGMHTREADAIIQKLNAQLRAQEKMASETAKKNNAATEASRANAEAARRATELNEKAAAAQDADHHRQYQDLKNQFEREAKIRSEEENTRAKQKSASAASASGTLRHFLWNAILQLINPDISPADNPANPPRSAPEMITTQAWDTISKQALKAMSQMHPGETVEKAALEVADKLYDLFSHRHLTYADVKRQRNLPSWPNLQACFEQADVSPKAAKRWIVWLRGVGQLRHFHFVTKISIKDGRDPDNASRMAHEMHEFVYDRMFSHEVAETWRDARGAGEVGGTQFTMAVTACIDWLKAEQHNMNMDTLKQPTFLYTTDILFFVAVSLAGCSTSNLRIISAERPSAR